MLPLASLAALLSLLAVEQCAAQSFTISGGQIFTPGLAVLDAPQPGTPLGGENLHIALDVSANGRLNLPPYAENSPSQIHNISIFLYSYTTGKNFTVTNVTESAGGASLGDIMFQEEGSTVKHVNWRWPDCLVGDGQPRTLDSDRGVYNISIRQNFRLNGEEHYTIFDLPIAVTNRIEDMGGARPSCDALNNNMMAPEDISMTDTLALGVLFAPGDSTEVEVILPDGIDPNNGIGGTRPIAKPEDGLGSGTSAISRTGTRLWAYSVVSLVMAFLL